MYTDVVLDINVVNLGEIDKLHDDKLKQKPNIADEHYKTGRLIYVRSRPHRIPRRESRGYPWKSSVLPRLSHGCPQVVMLLRPAFHWMCIQVSSKIRACIQEPLMDPNKKWLFENTRDVVALFTTNRYRMGALVVMSATRLSFYIYVVQLAASQVPKWLTH